MGDVVNLNQFRKRRDRTEKARRSAAKRVRTGRTKSERQMTQAEAARTEAAHEGQRIEHPSDEPEGGGGRGPEGD